MRFSSGQLSPSGVWVSADFRSNLIIDRYDPVFASMRANKLKHLRSINSEDALTWNVFRSLRQIAPSVWFPTLWRLAFPSAPMPDHQQITVSLWRSMPPPPGLVSDGDEGHSEIDVIIEAQTWVWFIEAKFRSDISKGTTTRPDRDQILRNIDVGTYYAAPRRFHFSLLMLSESLSTLGSQRLRDYEQRETVYRLLSGHRPDRLDNLEGVGRLFWTDLGSVLAHSEAAAPREDEREIAGRAVRWLVERKLYSAL